MVLFEEPYKDFTWSIDRFGTGRTRWYPEPLLAELTSSESRVWVPSVGEYKDAPPKVEPSDLLLNLIRRV